MVLAKSVIERGTHSDCERSELIVSSHFLPSAVKPPPLGRVLSYVRFNEFGKLGSILEDIAFIIPSDSKLKRWFYNESMMV